MWAVELNEPVALRGAVHVDDAGACVALLP